MAALTTTRDGDWANTTAGVTPWTALTGSGAGGVPGAGDSVTISHNLTISSNTTIGDGTDSVMVTCLTGTVTLAAGVTWTIRGHGSWGQSRGGGSYLTVITMGAGAAIVLDCDAGHTPIQTFTTDSKVVINGTSGAHCSIRTKSAAKGDASDSAGNPGRFADDGAGNSSLATIASYCDFYRLGDVSNTAWGPCYMTVASEPGAAVSFDWCTFDNCCAVDIRTNQGTSTVSFTNCTWTNPVGTWDTQYSPIHLVLQNALTSGTRLLQYCKFFGDSSLHLNPYLEYQTDLTIDTCYFDQALSPNYGAPAWAAFNNCFVRKTIVNEEMTWGGSSTNCYFLRDAASGTPNSFLLINSTGSSTFSGNVFEHTLSFEGLPAVATTDAVTVARTVTLTGNVMTTNGVGGACGAMFVSYTAAGQPFDTVVVCEHNTLCVGTQSGGKFEIASFTHPERVGACSSFKSNLLWRTGAAANYAIDNTATATEAVTDAVAASAITNNAYCGLATQAAGYWTSTHPTTGATTISDGTPYRSPMSGATVPGAGDVNLGVATNVITDGPQFIDPTRDLAAWDLSNGGPGTIASALSSIQADLTLIAAVVAWVRAGFVTQAPALHNTAHDGTDIGAMPFLVLPPPPSIGGECPQLGNTVALSRPVAAGWI